MHIVYISREYGDSMRGGGIATYIQLISEGLSKKGHKVTVITAADDTRKESFKKVNENLSVVYLAKGDFFISSVEHSGLAGLKKFRIFYRFFNFRNRVAEYLKSLTDVDIVEIQDYGAEGLCINELKVPVVLRLQTPSLLDRKTQGIKKLRLKSIPDWFVGIYEHKLIRKARFITSCSQALLDWTKDHVGINAEKSSVIYNPVKVDRAHNSISIPQGGKVKVLFAGTVSKEKGIGELVEAVAILRKDGVEIDLEIAGKLGGYGEDLKGLVEKNHYFWCNFHGHVQKDTLKDLYSKSTVACFPSWWEAMGLVCVEAMHAGTVVLGSNAGGMAELIEDGVDGFLVSPKSPRLLAEKIMDIISLSLEERTRITSNAKEKIINLYSVDYITGQSLDFYTSILEEFKTT